MPERLYPILKDIWEDEKPLNITEEEEAIVVYMLNRSYDRGCNHGAKK
jgi:hypothetical protein